MGSIKLMRQRGFLFIIRNIIIVVAPIQHLQSLIQNLKWVKCHTISHFSRTHHSVVLHGISCLRVPRQCEIPNDFFFKKIKGNPMQSLEIMQ